MDIEKGVMILVGRLEGKRPTERVRRRWEDNFKVIWRRSFIKSTIGEKYLRTGSSCCKILSLRPSQRIK